MSVDCKNVRMPSKGMLKFLIKFCSEKIKPGESWLYVSTAVMQGIIAEEAVTLEMLDGRASIKIKAPVEGVKIKIDLSNVTNKWNSVLKIRKGGVEIYEFPSTPKSIYFLDKK